MFYVVWLNVSLFIYSSSFTSDSLSNSSCLKLNPLFCDLNNMSLQNLEITGGLVKPYHSLTIAFPLSMLHSQWFQLDCSGCRAIYFVYLIDFNCFYTFQTKWNCEIFSSFFYYLGI